MGDEILVVPKRDQELVLDMKVREVAKVSSSQLEIFCQLILVQDMYPGLSMAPNHQLSLSGFSDLPDPYLIPKKETSNDDLGQCPFPTSLCLSILIYGYSASLAALDGENGNGNGQWILTLFLA